MSTPAPFRIGPLGYLEELPGIPSGQDVPGETVLVGASRTSMGGRTTRDVMAFYRTWKFEWHALSRAERDRLEAMYLGYRGVPLRLVDPTRRNRLTLPDSGVGATSKAGAPVLDATWGTWNTAAVNAPTGSSSWNAGPHTVGVWKPSSTTARSLNFATEERRRFPLVSAETMSAGLWVYSTTTALIGLNVGYYTAGATTAGSVVAVRAAQSVPANTWTFIGDHWVVGSSTVASGDFRVAVTPSAASATVHLAQPQVEQSATPTAWTPGGGAPVVLIEKFEAAALQTDEYDVGFTVREA